MGTYTSAFIAIELMSVLIVAIFVVKVDKTSRLFSNYLYFWIIQIVFVLGAINQVVWILSDQGLILLAPWQLWIVNGLYIIAVSALSFAWFRFISMEVIKISQSKFIDVVYKIQVIVFVLDILLTVTSVWSGWIYKIDANGVYCRGPLHYIFHVPLCYGQWIWSLAIILIARNKCELSVRYRLRHLLLASSFPILGSVLQLVSYEIPFLDITLVLGSLMLFMDIQRDQIANDALTSLNNRFSFLKTYDRMASRAEKHPFYLFVADINGFKLINDNYGHLVGDKALLTVSQSLRKAAHKFPNVYICRYGGDEFIAMAPKESVGRAEDFMEYVNKVVATDFENSEFDFQISFSVGYCEIAKKDVDVNTAFACADKMLYSIKND